MTTITFNTNALITVTYPTVAELRTYDPTQIVSDLHAIVDGRDTSSDGLGGIYTWIEDSTADDDGQDTIAITGLATGRFVRTVKSIKGDTGDTGPTGPQGPIGDVTTAVTDAQTAAAASATASAASATSSASSATGSSTSATASAASATAAAASAMAAATTTGLTWASVRTHPENGESQTAQGGFYVVNTNNLWKNGGTAGGTPWGVTGGAIAVIWNPAYEIYDGQRRAPMLVAGHSQGFSASNRDISFGYIARADTGQPSHVGQFRFRMIQETAGGTLDVYGPAPSKSDGALLAVARIASGTVTVDLFRLSDGAKISGSSTSASLPGAWAGISNLTNNMSIGLGQESAYPVAAGTNRTGMLHCRGEFGGFVMLDADLDDSDWEAIASGADIETTATSANIRFFAPFAENGALSTRISSNNAAYTDTAIGQRGVVLPGSTLRRQSVSTYLTIDRKGDPCICPIPVSGGLTSGLKIGTGTFIKLTGKSGGLTSGRSLEARVLTKGGVVWQDWKKFSTIGSTWSGYIYLPACAEPLRIQVRDPQSGYVAHLNHDVVTAAVIRMDGQSQDTFALGNVPGVASTPDSLNYQFDGAGADTCFIVWRTSENLLTTQHAAIRRGEHYNTNWGGSSQVTFFNELRRMGVSLPIVLVQNAIAGTAISDLMTTQTNRSWQMIYDTMDLIEPDQNGLYAPSIHIETVHSSDCGNGADYWTTLEAYLWGIPTAHIAGPFVDWLYSGAKFSENIPFVLMPRNREIDTTPVTQSDDNGTTANTNAALYARAPSIDPAGRFLLGVPCDVHTLEGGGFTHPAANDPDGQILFTRYLATSAAYGLGVGPYRGFDVTIDPNTPPAFTDGTNTAIRVTYTGPMGFNLRTYKAVDNPTNFQVADNYQGFTATIESPRTVLLTITSGSWSSGVVVEDKPGGPGEYASSYNNAGWISGNLCWGPADTPIMVKGGATRWTVN